MTDDADSTTARTIRAIRAEGYAEAVAKLRDEAAFNIWRQRQFFLGRVFSDRGQQAAEYLEAQAVKEAP